MSLKNNFSTYLKDIEYPIKKEGWDISGILKKASNNLEAFLVLNDFVNLIDLS